MNKTVDLLVVTNHLTRLVQAFLCRGQSAKQVVVGQFCWTYISVYMSTIAKVQVLRVG